MPRYFFDVFDGDGLLADGFGDEFASDQDAAEQARSLLPEFMIDKIVSDHDCDAAVSIRTEDGEVIYRALALLRSQWVADAGMTFRVEVNQHDFQISHSMALRAETSSLVKKVRIDAFEVFSGIQRAVALLETSRRIIEGREK